MRVVRYLMLAPLVAITIGGPACSEKRVDEVAKATGAAVDKTKEAADIALQATRKGADKALDATKTLATKTQKVVATTGEVITDAWLTTKVTAKLADEKQLEGSSIDVDTSDHVVRLRGTVASMAMRNRAAEIAGGTEGVTRVVNQIVVK